MNALKDLLPYATLFTVLAALISSIVAIRQFGLARRQFARTHRPELIVPFCEVCWAREPVRGVPDDARGLGARFTVVNKGAGEARDVTVKAAILLTDPLNAAGYLLDLPVERHTLESGERIELSAFVDPESAGAIPFLRDTAIRLIGHIAYADANNRKRETGFARLYDAAGKRWITDQGSQYDYSY